MALRIEYTRSVRDSLAALIVKSAIEDYKLKHIKNHFLMQHNIYILWKMIEYYDAYLSTRTRTVERGIVLTMTHWHVASAA